MKSTEASPRRAPDWVAIRRLYEEGGTPIAEIAAAHGITASMIQKRRAVCGWPKRSRRTGSKPAKSAGDTPAGRRALVSRLMKVVDQNLKLMEMRMEADEPGTAADRERETRSIGALTRTLGKLTELQAETDTARAAGSKSRSSGPADEGEADRLRLEIAERILRLGERWERS